MMTMTQTPWSFQVQDNNKISTTYSLGAITHVGFEEDTMYTYLIATYIGVEMLSSTDPLTQNSKVS